MRTRQGRQFFSRVYARASRLSRRLIAPGAFKSTSYPVRKAIVDEKAAVTAVYKSSGLSAASPSPAMDSTSTVLGVIQKSALTEDPEVSEPFPFKPSPSSILTFVNLLLPTTTVKNLIPIVDPRLLQTWNTFFLLEGAGSTGRRNMGRGVSIVTRAIQDIKFAEGSEIESSVEVPVCYPATLERLACNPALPAAAHEVMLSSSQLISFIQRLLSKARSSKSSKTDQHGPAAFKSKVAKEGEKVKLQEARLREAQSSYLSIADQARRLAKSMSLKLSNLSSGSSASSSKAPSFAWSSFTLQALLLEMWTREAIRLEASCSAQARRASGRLLLAANEREPEPELFNQAQMGKATALLDQTASFENAGLDGQPSIDLSSLSNPLSFFSVLIRGFAHERSISSLSHVALQVSPLNPKSLRKGFFITSMGEPQSKDVGSLQQGFMIKVDGSQHTQAHRGFISEARFCFEDGDESDECILRPSRISLPTSLLPDLLVMPVFIDPSTTSSAVLPHLRKGRKQALDQAEQTPAADQALLRIPLRVGNMNQLVSSMSVVIDARRYTEMTETAASITFN